MAKITQFQTNFKVGELDPLLRSRTDLAQYQDALEEATNVIVQPQGGIRRRDGTVFIHDFGSSFTTYKLIPFEYSVDDSYLLVLVPARIYVFKNSVLQTNINGSGNDYITATALTSDIISSLNYTQAVDTLIFCHEDLETKRLVRNTDTSWDFENLPITNIPKYAYEFDTHEPNFTITPGAVSGNTTLTASSVTTDNGTAQGGTTSTITLKAATSFTSDDQPNGMFIEITSGTGAGQTRHVEDYVASTKVLTVSPDWDTAPDGTSNYDVKAFKPAAVGEYAQVKNGFGRARYVEYVSDTQMKVFVESPFFDTTGVTAGNWESEHGYEDVWSTTRGWPRSASFHEGRLYFGGSKSRPNTIWGSKVVDYFNFDTGTGLDDEGVEATINTNQLNVIHKINAGPDLQIFTTGGEFIVSQLAGEPITPSNFLVKNQSRIGSKEGIPIHDLAGATLFIQRQGKSLISFQFNDGTASYGTTPLSVLSSHLLNDPVDFDIRRASSTDETDRLFLVNTDGTMAIYSMLVSQDIIAPSRFTTDGTFEAVGIEVDKAFVIVKRTIDGVDNYMLERFDETVVTDSAKTGGAASSVTMDHLEGETVSIIRDGIVEAEQVVGASPYTVTFASPATSTYEVGLNYTVQAKTMPAEPQLASGSVVGVKKRILQVDALLNKTQNMSINGQLVSFRKFGEDVLDEPIAEFTGLKTVHGLLGYDASGQITITQTKPMKMTVLGLEYKMSVGN